MKLRWNDLWVENQWGECVATDVEGLASSIRIYLERRGLELGISERQIAQTIIEWIWRRQIHTFYQLHGPRTRSAWPSGWDVSHEDVWSQWIEKHLTPESIEDEILYPVFGSDVRSWEGRCDGWRNELYYFLPFWIERSFERLDEMIRGNVQDDTQSASADDEPASADW